MSNFGHAHGNVGNCFIDAWGKGPFMLTVGGKSYRFEDSDMFGPHRLRADGELHAKNFGERSAFWDAHSYWVVQGRKVESDGVTCIWREPIPTIVQRIGNVWLTIQQGEPNAHGATRYIQVQATKRSKP